MIAQGMTTSFKQQILVGTHNFTASTGDSFYAALYLSTASLGPTTTVYTTTGEVTGTGYTAGGTLLTSVTPTTSGTTAIITFANASWPNSTITARGALIYNASKSNKAVAVLDFGSDKVSSNTTFLITFPAATADSSVLRIV